MRQPIKYLATWLDNHANQTRYLFLSHDLRALFPQLSEVAFRVLLNRAVRGGYLHRVCRGVYKYPKINPVGLLLFHVAAILRANAFNYLSLETVLSEAGIISQIPINRITLMSSGRTNVISCGTFGSIEFVHTNQKPQQVMRDLQYDASYHLWRANVFLALRDMRATHRNNDLINWDIAHEFV